MRFDRCRGTGLRAITDWFNQNAFEAANSIVLRSLDSDPRRFASENHSQLRSDRLEASSRTNKVLDKTANSSQSLGHDLPSTGRT